MKRFLLRVIKLLKEPLVMIAALFILLFFTNFLGLTRTKLIITLRAQVAELQARPQGYSQVLTLDVPHANGTSFESELDLVPGAKALVVLHSTFTGHLDFYVRANVDAKAIGGFNCTNFYPSQKTDTVNGQWEGHDFSSKPLGVVNGERTCFIEVSNSGSKKEYVLFQTIATL